MQFGVDGQSPRDGVPYMSCTPEPKLLLQSKQLSSKRSVMQYSSVQNCKWQLMCQAPFGKHNCKKLLICSMCSTLLQSIPSLGGLGAAPNVNRAPRTPTFMLRRTSSLQNAEARFTFGCMPYLSSTLSYRTCGFLRKLARHLCDLTGGAPLL